MPGAAPGVGGGRLRRPGAAAGEGRARRLLPLLAGALAAAGLGGGLFAVLHTTVTHATRGEELASAAVAGLHELQPGLVESRIRIGDGRPVQAACYQIFDRTALIVPRDGPQILIQGGAAQYVAGRAAGSARLGAEAVLAGCPSVIADLLARRLQDGLRAYTGTATIRGEPAYRFLVGEPPNRTVAFLARESFQPLAVELAGGGLSGSSVLQATPIDPVRSCYELLSGSCGHG